jgi:diguanylate cyclase (GGDEF)-like protein
MQEQDKRSAVASELRRPAAWFSLWRLTRMPFLTSLVVCCIITAIAINTVLAVRETDEQNEALRQQRSTTIVKHNLDELQQMLLDEHEETHTLVGTRPFYREALVAFPLAESLRYADDARKACSSDARCESLLQELKVMLMHFGQVSNEVERQARSQPGSIRASGPELGELDARFLQVMQKVVEIRLAADAVSNSTVNNATLSARRIADILLASGIGASLMLLALFARNARITSALRKTLAKADAYQAELQHQARFDSLTGLVNRSHLMTSLTLSLDRALATKRQVFVVFVDLDNFKQVNDSLGHRVGDLLLAQMAARIDDVVGAQGITARYGGDEFVIVADALQDDDVRPLLDALLAATAQPVQIGEHELFIEASIGVSVLPSDGTDAETLIRHADAAMYLAKENGRNQYQFYRKELSEGAASRLKISTRLHKALKAQSLRVLYQPQVDMKTGALVGAEALLRWNDSELGEVPPSLFVPIAEETGLIRAIGAGVLSEACRECVRWNEATGRALRISVNVSPIQLEQGDFVQLVSDVLAESGLPPELLELEVTEGALMRNADDAARTLAKLRALGIRIAIDDFGTGYSSLSYLNRFGADRLKIDRAFVKEIGQDGQMQAITLAIIAMANAVKIEVIAEGVETGEHRDFLLEHGCSEAQGFLYSPAVPGQQIQAMVSRSTNGASMVETC